MVIQITVRCVSCKRTRVVSELKDAEMCEHCFSPMAVINAISTSEES